MVSLVKFFDLQMCVRPTKAEAVDCGPAWITGNVLGPWMTVLGNRELRVGQVNLRTGTIVVVLPRNNSRFESFTNLDHRGRARGPTGVSNQRFHTTQLYRRRGVIQL